MDGERSRNILAFKSEVCNRGGGRDWPQARPQSMIRPTASDTNPQSGPGGRLGNWSARELWLLVLAVGFAIYAPSLQYQFVYDDVTQIVGNSRVQSWEHLPGYFTSHAWAHLYGQANYYRPLFLLWLLLNHTLFGLNPLGWHLTTVMAHLAAGSLVYVLARQLLEDARAAAVAALVFLLHPAQVECVAWVSGVSEPVQAVLLLSGLVAYIKYDRRPLGSGMGAWLAASLLAYFVALLWKEGGALLPVLIFLYSAIYGRAANLRFGRRISTALRPCLLYVLPLAAYLLVRGLALHGGLQAKLKVSVETTLLTIPSLLWFYLKHLVFPASLALNYHTPYVTQAGLRDFFLPLAGVLLAAAALWWWGRRSRLAAFSALWMAVPLALPLATAGLFPFFDLVHDRYLYLPMAGLALLLGEGYQRLSRWRPGMLPAVAVTVVAVLLAGQTLSYERTWRNNLTVFRRAVETSPGAMLPKVLLADAVADPAEALRLLQEADAVSGGHWLTQTSLGVWYSRNRRDVEAEQYLMRSIERNPESPAQYYELGEVRLRMGQRDQAVAPFRRAVEIVPDNMNYRLRYAASLELAGQLEAALVELRYVLSRQPEEPILRGHVDKLEQAVARSHKQAPER